MLLFYYIELCCHMEKSRFNSNTEVLARNIWCFPGIFNNIGFFNNFDIPLDSFPGKQNIKIVKKAKKTSDISD